MADVGEHWRSNLVWRDDYIFWTARGVSKTGCLGPHDDALLELGRVLTRDEAVWLYCQIRDQSRRGEGEWRAEFLWLFRQVEATDLPPLPFGERLEKYAGPEPPQTWGESPYETEIPF